MLPWWRHIVCIVKPSSRCINFSMNIWTTCNPLYSVEQHFTSKVTVAHLAHTVRLNMPCFEYHWNINMRDNGHSKVRAAFSGSVCNLRSELLVGTIYYYVMKHMRNHDDIRAPKSGQMTAFCTRYCVETKFRHIAGKVTKFRRFWNVQIKFEIIPIYHWF